MYVHVGVGILRGQKVVMDFPGVGVTVIVSLRTELLPFGEHPWLLTSTVNGSFNLPLQGSGRLLFEKPTPMLSGSSAPLSSLVLKPVLKCLY